MGSIEILLYTIVSAVAGAAWVCWRYIRSARPQPDAATIGDEVLLED